MKMWIFVAAMPLLLQASVAQARVFDFKNEFLAIYFGGSFGTTSAGDGAYALSSGGGGIVFDKKVASASSAEGGIALTLGRITLRLGVDYIMPRDQMGVIATDAGGTQLFSLDSKLSAFVLLGNLELLAYRGSRSRALIGAGYGTATANLQNQYTMTATGTTQLGVTDYTEEATGTAPMMQGYLGWEFLFTDTATAALQGGYRYLQIPSFKSTKTTTAITGSQSNGSAIHNYDGSERSMNLSGAFVGITFRFYL